MRTLTTLDEMVVLRRGFDLPAPSRRPGPVPVLGSAGISGWHDTVPPGPAAGPSVTVGRSGSSIGVATYHPGPCWPLNTTLFVEDFLGNDPRYVYYLLRSIDFRGYDSGSVQPSLNRNHIAGVKVSRPGIREQRAIGALLGALDDKIGVNERIGATYEELLAAVFVRNGWDDEPTDRAGATALGSLVECNPVCPRPRLGAAGDAVYVDMAAVPAGGRRVTAWRRRPPAPGTRFRNGDTVLARISPCLENGKTAFIDVLADGEVGVGSTEFIVLRARAGVPPLFAYAVARSARFRRYAIGHLAGTSGRQRCPVDVLPGFPIRRPDPAELHRFGAEATAAFDHLRSLDAETAELKALRDALLPRLIGGELRLTDGHHRQ